MTKQEKKTWIKKAILTLLTIENILAPTSIITEVTNPLSPTKHNKNTPTLPIFTRRSSRIEESSSSENSNSTQIKSLNTNSSNDLSNTQSSNSITENSLNIVNQKKDILPQISKTNEEINVILKKNDTTKQQSDKDDFIIKTPKSPEHLPLDQSIELIKLNKSLPNQKSKINSLKTSNESNTSTKDLWLINNEQQKKIPERNSLSNKSQRNNFIPKTPDHLTLNKPIKLLDLNKLSVNKDNGIEITELKEGLNNLSTISNKKNNTSNPSQPLNNNYVKSTSNTLYLPTFATQDTQSNSAEKLLSSMLSLCQFFDESNNNDNSQNDLMLFSTFIFKGHPKLAKTLSEEESDTSSTVSSHLSLVPQIKTSEKQPPQIDKNNHILDLPQEYLPPNNEETTQIFQDTESTTKNNKEKLNSSLPTIAHKKPKQSSQDNVYLQTEEQLPIGKQSNRSTNNISRVDSFSNEDLSRTALAIHEKDNCTSEEAIKRSLMTKKYLPLKKFTPLSFIPTESDTQSITSNIKEETDNTDLLPILEEGEVEKVTLNKKNEQKKAPYQNDPLIILERIEQTVFNQELSQNSSNESYNSLNNNSKRKNSASFFKSIKNLFSPKKKNTKSWQITTGRQDQIISSTEEIKKK